MHFVRLGVGVPIVFIHGWRLRGSVEADDYESILAHRSGWSRVYIDLPGMGATPRDPTIIDADGFASAVLEFLDHELDGWFAVAGTSFGAELARVVAERHVQRVCGLLLRVPRGAADERERGMGLSEERLGSDAERDDALDRDRPIPGSFNAESDEKRSALWEPARRAADQRYLEEIRDDPARYSLSDPPRASFDRPTLIVTGRQDGRAGWSEAVALADQYSRATFAALDRAGHPLPVGSGKVLFSALVLDWLDRMEEWLATCGGAVR